MAVRIEKILCTVLHEAHKKQVEETMEVHSERREGFYKTYLDICRSRLSSHTELELDLL